MDHAAYMDLAARLALRGHGGAEPNPLVGCVIVSGDPGPSGDGRIVGWGYHRRCGGPHAEIEALRRAGAKAAGATAYLTLEPCNHTGRTGPCADALVDAGVARAVIAEPDPNPVASGGVATLEAAGIVVETLRTAAARVLNAPYLQRVRRRLPWVICKWAQTIDGRIATRRGESRWISNARSRRLVHRERGRVDAILTGIGTVLADDPQLVARGVRRRRIARRVVYDPRLQTPAACRLVEGASETPTTVTCPAAVLDERAGHAAALQAAGVDLLPVPEPSLTAVLHAMVDRYDTANVLVEGGAAVLGGLFAERLVNEAWVVVAPILFGDDEAVPAVRGLTVETLTDGAPLQLLDVHRRGDDVILHYRTAIPG